MQDLRFDTPTRSDLEQYDQLDPEILQRELRRQIPTIGQWNLWAMSQSFIELFFFIVASEELWMAAQGLEMTGDGACHERRP